MKITKTKTCNCVIKFEMSQIYRKKHCKLFYRFFFNFFLLTNLSCRCESKDKQHVACISSSSSPFDPGLGLVDQDEGGHAGRHGRRHDRERRPRSSDALWVITFVVMWFFPDHVCRVSLTYTPFWWQPCVGQIFATVLGSRHLLKKYFSVPSMHECISTGEKIHPIQEQLIKLS